MLLDKISVTGNKISFLEMDGSECEEVVWTVRTLVVAGVVCRIRVCRVVKTITGQNIMKNLLVVCQEWL